MKHTRSRVYEEVLDKRCSPAEKMEEDDVAIQKEMKEVSKETGAKRKKLFLEKAQGRDKRWRKMLRRKNSKDFSQNTKEKMFLYSSKNYKVLSEMLEDFDRLDVEELYRLVKEKYSASRLEGFDLML
ncbi:hypothetical protein Tco_0887888 [Tanacetum coccineum]